MCVVNLHVVRVDSTDHNAKCRQNRAPGGVMDDDCALCKADDNTSCDRERDLGEDANATRRAGVRSDATNED